jgi:hypothetical protein
LQSKVYGNSNFDATTFKDQSAFKNFDDEDGEISLNSDRQSPEAKNVGVHSAVSNNQ